MKRAVLILLCLAVLLASAGVGAFLLYLTPRGALRADKPEDVVQVFAESHDKAFWREEFVRLCALETGEFEDAAAVTGLLFDASITGEDFRFRPADGGDDVQDYILSCGGTDFLTIRARYDGKTWHAECAPLTSLRSETRTLSVLVPEDAAVTVNGVAVGEQYIAERGIVYEDMSALELRFAEIPHLVRYEIPGIFEAAEVGVSREGGVAELYSDGTEWRYTLPDAGGYAFSVSAPAEATVCVNGAELTDSELTATSAYVTNLDVPAELEAGLPSYRIYNHGGLYTKPEITAILSDGTKLEARLMADTVVFTLPPSEALYEECHVRVEEFLRALCEYGAGHSARYGPAYYVERESPVQYYLSRASGSLYWTVGVTTSYEEITASDFIALGSDAFICRGHIRCTTTTRNETVNFDLENEMLWVRSGTTWVIRDLAFVKMNHTKTQ